MKMPSAYEPSKFEDKIYREWEKAGLFNPDKLKRSGQRYFSIVLPPPNVTGTLHLGHAAMLAIEDLLIRYKRMKGFDAVWIPGTDHASIATQNVVEKKLWSEKKLSRYDLGRKKFLAEINKFVKQSKDIIHNQLRKMGSSLDWSREAYTLDESRSKAVRKVFKMMYDDRLIYRGDRVVNWCPRCASTLADDELVYKEADAKLYTFKYDDNFPFCIATTRPETKLGDTAVAVNPKDKRYAKYIGKAFQTNFCGVNLSLPIIAERGIEMEFGTGALGVTPAHSMVDYEMAQKNGLAMIKVIDETGRITDAGGKFFGLSAEEARAKIVTELKSNGLLLKEENFKHNISLCYRCKTVIEPLPSKQWFINVNQKSTLREPQGDRQNKLRKIIGRDKASLKEMAIAVVKHGLIEIIPQRFEKIYNNWMNNLHDWCISRQLWFGHQIPVWYKKEGADTEIFLMRHGEALSNKLNQLNSDVNNQKNGLTPKGKKQVEATAEILKSEKFEIIIASDFKRARETAEILAKKLKIKVATDERLREVGCGKFEGRPDHEMVVYREGKGFESWHHKSPSGIESFDKLKKRVFSAMSDFQKKYKGKKVLAVAHGDVIRVARGYGKKIGDEAIFRLGYPDVASFVKLIIPAEEKIRVSEEDINERGWIQDGDTLDTWFSSGLWSFTSLLPKDWDGKKFIGKDIERFHPTSILDTGYDILPFWVSRMILMTNYVMAEVPFEKVYLHGLIRDKEGDKMSKSKPETAIDPVEAGQKYGFDAVRLSLLMGNAAGKDITLYDEKIEGYRNFVNKLWNIARFVLSNSKPKAQERGQSQKLEILKLVQDDSKDYKPTVADKWILSRFNKLKIKTTALLDEYRFSEAGELLREFTWNEFADWYLETAKIEDGKDKILFNILGDLLKMWHPFTPFVTEAINQRILPDVGAEYYFVQSLMIEKWPKPEKRMNDAKAEKEFAFIQNIIAGVRNVRAEHKIEPARKIKAIFRASGRPKKIIEENINVISGLARLSEVNFSQKRPDNALAVVIRGLEIFLAATELVGPEQETARRKKEKENLKNYIANLEKKLQNEQFLKNAPALIVAKEKQKLDEAKIQLDKSQ